MSGARPLVILGTGGNALDVLDVAAALGTAWRVVGFLDDALPPGSEQDGFPVLGRLDEAARLAGPGGTLAEALFLNAIGSERNHAARPSIVARTGLPAKRFATLVHPAAGVSSRASLGRGCCIGFGACVGGRTRIGDHAWVGPGCVIGHDSVLEPFALMAPRATISGFVRLGTGSYVGSGATVRQRVTVGENALVGLGAVVLHDVAPGTVVVGNPARELKRHA